MIFTKMTNLEQYKGLTVLNKGNTSIKKAQKLGYIVKTNLQAHIINNIENLEKEFLENKLVDKINIKGNSKLGEIPSISFPNIFLQQQFLIVVINNQKLKKMKSIRILFDYFQNNKVCVNCEGCFGGCYNNYDLNQYANKGVSDLRSLLAFITSKEELFISLYNKIRVYNIFRINSNGEIHNKELLDFYIRLAEKCKKTTFYTYTKSYQLFEQFLKDKNKLPKNFILNISIFGNKEKVDKSELINKTFNKFITLDKEKFDEMVKNKEIKKSRICKGDCMECDLCQKTLPKSNNKIYCCKHI